MAHTDHVDPYELYESYESNCIVIVLTCLDRRLSLKILTKLILTSWMTYANAQTTN